MLRTALLSTQPLGREAGLRKLKSQNLCRVRLQIHKGAYDHLFEKHRATDRIPARRGLGTHAVLDEPRGSPSPHIPVEQEADTCQEATNHIKGGKQWGLRGLRKRPWRRDSRGHLQDRRHRANRRGETRRKASMCGTTWDPVSPPEPLAPMITTKTLGEMQKATPQGL